MIDPTRPTRRPAAAAALHGAAVAASALVLGAGGCETYRVEYRDRPSFFAAAGAELPDYEAQPDGTLVVYRNRAMAGALQDRAERDENDRPFMIREKLEDGSIILRALVPEHVLANLMTCIRNEEYELIWSQLLSERTRSAYQEEGRGPEDFAAFFRKHRHDLAETVNRMSFGLLRSEVIVDNLGGGVSRFRFHPTVASELRFKTILMESETAGLKLTMIK